MSASKEYLKELVRQAMIRNPRASVTNVKSILDRNGVVLHRNTVWKHMRGIVRERTERMKHEDAQRAVAEYEDTIAALETELWRMVADREKVSPAIRTRAIETIAKAKAWVLEKKFDAGIFDRKLGTIVAARELNAEQRAFIDQSLSYVERERPRLPDGTEPIRNNPLGSALAQRVVS